jgi:hypothetical protein
MSIVGLLVGSVAVLRWTEGAMPAGDAGNELPRAGAAVIVETTEAAATAEDLSGRAAEVASSTASATTPPTLALASEGGGVTSARELARSAQPGLDPAKHQSRISFRGEIAAGLAALQKSVAPCGASDLTFTLDLETIDGGIRVLEASIASGAPPEDRRASCASAAVRGQVIPAPNALPGQHWQIPFSPHG